MRVKFLPGIGRLLASALLVLFPVMSSALELSTEERQLIRDFEQESGQSFKDFFAKVVHQRELCPDENADEVTVCGVALQKRTENYYVLFRGQKSMPTDEAADAANEALSRTFDDIGYLTGNWPTYDKPENTDKFIFFVFVSRESFEASPDNYLKARITRKSFGRPDLRERLFRYFMNSDLPCVNITSGFDDGIIRGSHIWIKNDLSERQLQKCVAEEIFNSMGIDEGVDVDSIFDWPLSVPGGAGLSDLHLLLLKLLYQQEFQPGQSKSETQTDITRLLSEN